METIRQWAVSICITLVATAIFSMLIPKGNMEKVMKFMLSIFFISCLLAPFLGGMPQIDLAAEAAELTNYTAINEQMQDQIRQLSEANLCRAIDEMLQQEGYQAKKVEAEVNILEDDSISITNITVTLEQTEEKNVQRVREFVEKQTAIHTQIILDGS